MVSIERVIPAESPEALYRDHLERYVFASQFVRDKTVLDLACGAGYGAPLMIAAGAASYIGMDISSKAINIAREKYGGRQIEFRIEDATNFSLPSGTIDLAISFETIEHIQYPEAVLSSLASVLKPSGTLLISTPNRSVSSPGNTLSSKPLNEFHVREWSETEFRQLLSKYFYVNQILFQGTYPLWKSLVLSQKDKIGLIRKVVEIYSRRKTQNHLATENSAAAAIEATDSLKIGISPKWNELAVYFVCVATPLND